MDKGFFALTMNLISVISDGHGSKVLVLDNDNPELKKFTGQFNRSKIKIE